MASIAREWEVFTTLGFESVAPWVKFVTMGVLVLSVLAMLVALAAKRVGDEQ